MYSAIWIINILKFLKETTNSFFQHYNLYIYFKTVRNTINPKTTKLFYHYHHKQVFFFFKYCLKKKTLISKIMHKYNRKSVVNKYVINKQKHDQTKKLPNILHVRNLPKDITHGVQPYKRSQAIINKYIQSPDFDNKRLTKQSWLNDFDHFKNLKFIKYEGSSTLSQYINLYIEKIKDYYFKLNKKSNSMLNNKIVQFNNKWKEEHSDHELSQMIDSNNNNIEIKKLIKFDNQSSLDKQYLSSLSNIKRDHFPTVYCSPKENSTQWNYLTNSIKLISQRNTICFSFDIEAFERDNNIITEIGISIYDPRENLHSLNPIFRNYHLIVSESLSLINKNWVLDMKECYLLGESLVLSLRQCVNFIQNLVNFYMIPDNNISDSWERAFVGHNIEGDFKWLKSMGVILPDTKPVSHILQVDCNSSSRTTLVIDTHKIYSACYGKEGSSLGKILRLFQLPHAFLHNAGNDAYYTLRLLLHLCDVNTRVQCSLDDISTLQKKIKQILERSKQEDKIIPMSYSLTLKYGNGNDNKNNNNPKNVTSKKKKDLVPQTEFGGSQWFSDAKQAFESTIVSKSNVFTDF